MLTGTNEKVVDKMSFKTQKRLDSDSLVTKETDEDTSE